LQLQASLLDAVGAFAPVAGRADVAAGGGPLQARAEVGEIVDAANSKARPKK
jgi:hypothetical protein